MQSNGGAPLPPPQFFNASLAAQYGQEQNPLLPPATAMPPPEVVQQALQQAMTEMLNRLAEINTDDDDAESNEGLSPELHKAFAQVLQNENLRRGIAENLARAAPALSDPKCQGVMLSVYVPPPPTHQNRGKLPSQPQKPPGGWFHKILNHHDDDEEDRRRTRTTNGLARVARIASVPWPQPWPPRKSPSRLPRQNAIYQSSNHFVEVYPFKLLLIQCDKSHGKAGLLENAVQSFFVTIAELSTTSWHCAIFRWNSTLVLEELVRHFGKC